MPCNGDNQHRSIVPVPYRVLGWDHVPLTQRKLRKYGEICEQSVGALRTYRGRFLRRLRTEWAEKYEVVPLNDGIPDQAPRGRIDACATDADPASSTKDQEVGEIGTE